jgi:Predicted nucleotide-binding protein containing TIR-like domain
LRKPLRPDFRRINQMANDVGLFKQINNAVLDLQSSDLQSYARPIRTLARLLQSQTLETINERITAGLNLETLLEESSKSQGGSVGSAQLAWPDEPEKVLGLTYLLIQRFAEKPDYMFNFGHTYFYAGSKIMSSIQSVIRQVIIPFVRDYKDFVMNQGVVKTELSIAVSNKVFIVHGHDGEARESVARFLEKIGLEAIILHEQANRGRTIIEKVEANGDVGFAVVLLTPDDQGRARGGALELRARQNVLLELGYFIGRLGRERVCALKRGELVVPSDFAGVVWETMDEGGGWKMALARELQAVGYSVDLNKAISFVS